MFFVFLRQGCIQTDVGIVNAIVIFGGFVFFLLLFLALGLLTFSRISTFGVLAYLGYTRNTGGVFYWPLVYLKSSFFFDSTVTSSSMYRTCCDFSETYTWYNQAGYPRYSKWNVMAKQYRT